MSQSLSCSDSVSTHRLRDIRACFQATGGMISIGGRLLSWSIKHFSGTRFVGMPQHASVRDRFAQAFC